MRNLSKDFRGNRPILINPAQAAAYLNKVNDVEIPLISKMSDMGDMLAAIFGEKPKLEKFPPIAVIPIKGVVGKNLSEMESLCGCCDIHDIEEMLEDCERDPSITTIILDVDSPGGTSVGVPELANRVRNSTKNVVSFTSSECCSAAYWIASQASSFYATPSSSVGSVGVYIAYPDCTEAYKMEGVVMDVIKSGTFKGAGIPGTSLDDNQRSMLQGEVDDIHVDFKNAVKSVRAFVEDSSMEGQMFSGKRGAEAGLVTGLVNGFDELIKEINPTVAVQVEAAEESESDSAPVSEPSESTPETDYSKYMSAADRALSGLSVKAYKSEDDDDEDKKSEDDEEDKKSEDEDEDKKSEDDDEDKKSEDDDEDKKSEDDDEDKKSEDDDEDKKSEAKHDDGVEPQPDNEEDPKKEKAKEDAEDEDDDGDKAVDTDAKHSRDGTDRNRSKRAT